MGISKISQAKLFLICMLMTAILFCYSNQVQAAQEGDYSYTVTAGGAQITGYSGAGGDVSVPTTLGGVPVTSIGREAFYYGSRITSVSIPEGVKSIGSCAFGNCEGLTSIRIPKSVASIGSQAFLGCIALTNITVDAGNLSYKSIDGVLYDKAGTTLIRCPEGLTSVGIPEGVTNIGARAFENCYGLLTIVLPESVTTIGEAAFIYCRCLTDINIPEGVTSIGEQAFYGCSGLTSISIPKSVANIGRIAFMDCPGLKSFSVDVGNKNYASIDGVLYNKSGTSLIKCPESLTSMNIPESVTGIGDWAFYNCASLTSLSLPEGLTSIGGASFYGCSGLTSMIIPKGVINIGDQAFDECPGLTSVIFSEGLKSIGARGFAYCTGLRNINLPKSVTSIGKSAFEGCSLTTITFNSPITTISDFRDTIPTTTKIIGYKNSTAEKYAKSRKRTFEIIGTGGTGPEAKPITVTVNGTPVIFDQPPVIFKGRTMVPMRAIFEALGTQVNWDAEKQTVTATKGGITIMVQIGSQQATVNGAGKTLDVPAQIIKNRTMVPVRFISESLGAEVNWDAKSRTVTINQ